MNGQHCENYDVKREMLTAVARDQMWPENSVVSIVVHK